LQVIPTDTYVEKPVILMECVRRSEKSSRPAKLSSDSAQIEQWDRPD